MNCHPTLCGMLVDVEDGRLVGVRGDPDNPGQPGFLCVRGQASREIIGNPKRLLTPADPATAARTTPGARPPGTRRSTSSPRACRRRGARRSGSGRATALFANNYGTRVASHLLRRFANL